MKNKSKSLSNIFMAVIACLAVLVTVNVFGISANADVNVPITDAIITELEEPSVGNLPDTEVTTGRFVYEASVKWKYKTGSYYSNWDLSKPFAAGQTYRVEITVDLSSNYYFKINGQNYVTLNGVPVNYTQVNDNKIVMYKDYTLDNFVTSVGVFGLEVPAVGKIPDTEVVCGLTGFTASVKWNNRTTHTDHPANQPFKANTSYTAVVTVTAPDGYSFKNIEDTTVYVNGVQINAKSFVSAKQFTVYVYYEVGTAPVEYVYVTLDTPLPGKAPDFTPECSGDGYVKDDDTKGFIDGVRWFDVVAGIYLTEDDVFVAGRTYLAGVYVAAGDGYRFTSDRKFVYLNDRLGSEEQSTNTRERIFNAYFTVPKEIVSVDISNMNVPKEGNTPDYWLDVDTEGVTIESVSWGVLVTDSNGYNRIVDMKETETFTDGNQYCVSIKLKNDGKQVFATKLNAQGNRYILTGYSIDGKKGTLNSWRELDDSNAQVTKDQYYYAEIVCWYSCESEILSEAKAWVDAPIGGKTPDFTASVMDGLTVQSVEWAVYVTESDGSTRLMEIGKNYTFEKGNTYVVTITVETVGNVKLAYDTDHYTFYGAVNGKRAEMYAVKGYDSNGQYIDVDPYRQARIVCWFDCDGDTVTRVDISDIIAPVAGVYPNYCRTVLGDGYNAIGSYAPGWESVGGEIVDIYAVIDGVGWFDVTDGKYDHVYENQTFIGGRTYEVRISLSVVGDYRFAVDGDRHSTVKGYINGVEAEIRPGNAGNEETSLYIAYRFTCEKAVLDSIDIEIKEPFIGEKPDWSGIDGETFFSNSALDGEQTAMLNGIAWGIYGADHMFTPNGDVVFAENTEYTVIIYLNLKEGYIIEDADTFEVYVNGLRVFDAMVFPAEPATILVMYTFPKTDCTHSIVPVERVPATCELDGKEAHYKCEKCGITYKDAAGKELLDEGEDWGIIYAVGHEFDDWTPHGEYNNCHVGKCHCGATEEADCVYVAKAVKGPSKYSKYDGTIFTCELCGNEGAFYVDETSCEHILGEWKNNERNPGVHYSTCECGKAYNEETCSQSVSYVPCPSEYSDMRDVLVYLCRDCGAYTMQPVEGEFATEESVTDTENNVTVAVPENSETVLPEGTQVIAKPVLNSDIPEGAEQMMEESLGADVDVIGGYDIGIFYNDVEIQPIGTITVTFDVAGNAEYSDGLTVVYYDDYSVEKVESVVFDWTTGTVTFETDHFSKYLVLKLTDTHEHSDADGKWESDGVYHWHTCSCGEIMDKAECVGGTATCTEKAVCATCNTAYGSTIAHNYGSEWKNDANEHWNECDCGDKTNKAAHADGNCDGRCDTCQHQISEGGTGTEPEPVPDPGDGNGGPNAGAIAVIVIVAVAVLGFAAYWFLIRKKK